MTRARYYDVLISFPTWWSSPVWKRTPKKYFKFRGTYNEYCDYGLFGGAPNDPFLYRNWMTIPVTDNGNVAESG